MKHLDNRPEGRSDSSISRKFKHIKVMNRTELVTGKQSQMTSIKQEDLSGNVSREVDLKQHLDEQTKMFVGSQEQRTNSCKSKIKSKQLKKFIEKAGAMSSQNLDMAY